MCFVGPSDSMPSNAFTLSSKSKQTEFKSRLHIHFSPAPNHNTYRSSAVSSRCSSLTPVHSVLPESITLVVSMSYTSKDDPYTVKRCRPITGSSANLPSSRTLMRLTLSKVPKSHVIIFLLLCKLETVQLYGLTIKSSIAVYEVNVSNLPVLFRSQSFIAPSRPPDMSH